HAVLVGGAVGEIVEVLHAQFVALELPIIPQVEADRVSHRPVVEFALIGPSGRPCEWHWMQVSLPASASKRAGLRIFFAVGWAACADPGPWLRSQPTVHSAGFLAAML